MIIKLLRVYLPYLFFLAGSIVGTMAWVGFAQFFSDYLQLGELHGGAYLAAALLFFSPPLIVQFLYVASRFRRHLRLLNLNSFLFIVYLLVPIITAPVVSLLAARDLVDMATTKAEVALVSDIGRPQNLTYYLIQNYGVDRSKFGFWEEVRSFDRHGGRKRIIHYYSAPFIPVEKPSIKIHEGPFARPYRMVESYHTICDRDEVDQRRKAFRMETEKRFTTRFGMYSTNGSFERTRGSKYYLKTLPPDILPEKVKEIIWLTPYSPEIKRSKGSGDTYAALKWFVLIFLVMTVVAPVRKEEFSSS